MSNELQNRQAADPNPRTPPRCPRAGYKGNLLDSDLATFIDQRKVGAIVNRMKAMVPVLALLFLAASSMHGSTISIQASVDGGGFVTVASSAGPAVGPINFTFGGFFMTNLGAIAHDSALGSDLLVSALDVNLALSGTHTLTIMTSHDGYTLPAGPLLQVQSGEGGSYGFGTTAVTFQTYADPNNTLFGKGDFTNGLQSAVPPSGSLATFDTGEASGVFTRLVTPYSLTSTTTITMTGQGTTANFANHEIVTVLSPVPEPRMSLLVGLGVVGFAASRRWIKYPLGRNQARA